MNSFHNYNNSHIDNRHNFDSLQRENHEVTCKSESRLSDKSNIVAIRELDIAFLNLLDLS